MKKMLKLTTVLTMVGTGLAAWPAFAEEQRTARATVADEEILVTARRVEEKLQDIPLAVSAIGSQALERAAVTEIKDLSATVPNLQIYASNTGGSSIVVAIRGQAQANSGLLYVDPAVGVYVDGLNVPRNSGLRSGLVDIQRVEVLRGPQGTLYGRNTTGGAVSIYSKDPAKEFGGYLQGSAGNYGAWGVQGVINLPLGEDLGLRLVADHSSHNPYGHEVTTGAGLYDENNTYLRAKLKYDGGAVRATLSGDYFRYRSAGPIMHLVGLVQGSRSCSPDGEAVGAVTAACPFGKYHVVQGGGSTAFIRAAAGLPFTNAGLDAAASILASYNRRSAANANLNFYDSLGTASDAYPFAAPDHTASSDGGSALLNLEYDVSDSITLRSISGWRSATRSEHYDIDATPYTLIETLNQTPKDDFYSEEFQILGKAANFKWVLGAYYSLEDGNDYSPNVAFQTAGSIRYNRALTFSRNISKAIFGQGSFKATDALTFTLGARYTWDNKRTRNDNTVQPDPAGSALTCAIPPSLINDPNGPVTSTGICGTILRGKFSAPTWLASVDYKVNVDTLLYAKYTRGYRSGGLQGRANTPTVTATFNNFEPERLDEGEVGVKSELLDRRLRLNLAVYYDKYDNVQRTITKLSDLGVGYSSTINAAKATLWGVEGELNLKVVEGFSLNGSFGYLHAKYDSYIAGTAGDRSFEDWPAPAWTYNIGANYERPIDGGTAGASLNWDYRSKNNLQPQAVFSDQVTQPGYGLLNGRAFVELKDAGLEVAVFGRNILNKKYYGAGISLEALGFNVLLTGEPRVFGLQVTKKFGAQ